MPARRTRPTHVRGCVMAAAGWCHVGSAVLCAVCCVLRAACCVQALGREAESWGLLADAVGAQGGVEA